MGRHKGWRVRKMGTSYVGFYAVTGTGKERSQSFTGPTARKDAERWAERQSAKLRLGKVARQVHKAVTANLKVDYLAKLKDLNRSESYRHDVDQVLGQLVEKVPDLGAYGAHKKIDDWLDGLEVSPRTRNKYLTNVRGLVAWAMAEDLLAEDPTLGIKEAKEPVTIKAQFTIAELRTMAQAITHPYHREFVLRFYLGLRTDEVVRLAWPDLDIDGRVWQVTGKGDKQRLAHVGEEALALLRLHGLGEGDVFDRSVRALHDAQHRRRLHAFCNSLGIAPGKRSPHSLRHSYAGVVTATGQPSLLLAAHMGHTSTQTTAEYTRLATRYVQAVEGWRRGQIELLTGWAEELPKKKELARG